MTYIWEVSYQLRIFFSIHIRHIILTRQRPYHCLTDWVIFFIRFLTRSTSGHTTVSQTRFFHFFKSYFRPRCQWPYHGLSDQFFFDILDKDINDHTMVLQTRSLVWSLTSNVERVTEKNWSVRPWYGH